jgi:hypothetical protein
MTDDDAIEVEFSDPYVDLMESFETPDEPIRTISNLSFVSIERDKIRGQSGDNKKVFDAIATVRWHPDQGSITFVTPDGKEWGSISIRREQ